MTQNPAVPVTFLVVGVLSLIGSAYLGFIAEPAGRDVIREQRDAEIIAYIESIDARFTGDTEFSIDERIDILKHEHMITADDVGTIELIKKPFNDKIDEAYGFDSPSFILFIVGFVTLISALLSAAYLGYM